MTKKRKPRTVMVFLQLKTAMCLKKLTKKWWRKLIATEDAKAEVANYAIEEGVADNKSGLGDPNLSGSPDALERLQNDPKFRDEVKAAIAKSKRLHLRFQELMREFPDHPFLAVTGPSNAFGQDALAFGVTGNMITPMKRFACERILEMCAAEESQARAMNGTRGVIPN